MMSKSAADPNGNYADSLADTVESNKESFTDDELKTLTADIETIKLYAFICIIVKGGMVTLPSPLKFKY